MPWSTPFDEPIRLRGRKLTTLQHAADYIMELPEDVQQEERIRPLHFPCHLPLDRLGRVLNRLPWLPAMLTQWIQGHQARFVLPPRLGGLLPQAHFLVPQLLRRPAGRLQAQLPVLRAIPARGEAM